MNSPELARYTVTLRNVLMGASLLVVLMSWRLSVALFVAGALVSAAGWLLGDPPATPSAISAEGRR